MSEWTTGITSNTYIDTVPDKLFTETRDKRKQ